MCVLCSNCKLVSTTVTVRSVHVNAYLSTVPNLAGQYRFLLLCPAVPPSTSFVLNSFDFAKFVRLFASTLVYGGSRPEKKVWLVPALAYCPGATRCG